ncbi:MAG: flavohemoglobin expression-modulating QEGLA motif protein, partial [Pirellulales bacterium]|nr:flavohemoglobin expression-modulating QEGLA motif protein [Pirellulales bacterium]
QADPGTEQLVKGEASFLIVSGAKSARRDLQRLLRRLIETLGPMFGRFLLVEIWSEPPPEGPPDESYDEWLVSRLRPAFTVVARQPAEVRVTMAVLERALRRVRVLRQPAETVVTRRDRIHPPGLPMLLSPSQLKELGCELIGLEVRPVYRDPQTAELYPAVLRSHRRGVGRGLKQAFFTFTRMHTKSRPNHYYSLGRRAMVKAVWDVDRQLAQISDSFDFLLQVTPVNAEAGWREFRRTRCQHSPQFLYRPLAAEPGEMKRQLYQIPVNAVEDPTLAYLFREKQDELCRKITMLSDVGTIRFLYGSLQVYGAVPPALFQLANDLLTRLPRRERPQAGNLCDAATFAARAAAEVEYYRRLYPPFQAKVIVRDDLYSGLLSSRGSLLIGKNTQVPPHRVDALLNHEIGTHLVTYYNGRAQPFRQLDIGLAGYDSLQEGLAVLAEYLVGGLDAPRVRLLAARVLAVQNLIDRASFVDTFRLLWRAHGFPQRTAYTITMRVYRGGGLTKDMLYLQGLVSILDYLHAGGDVEPLLVGKLAAEHVPMVRELQLRQVVVPPPVRPRYLDDPRSRQRFDQLGQVRSVLELVEVKK